MQGGGIVIDGLVVPPFQLCVHAGRPDFWRNIWPKIPLDSCVLRVLINLFIRFQSGLGPVVPPLIPAPHLLKAPEARSEAQCRRQERRGGVRSELELLRAEQRSAIARARGIRAPQNSVMSCLREWERVLIYNLLPYIFNYFRIAEKPLCRNKTIDFSVTVVWTDLELLTLC